MKESNKKIKNIFCVLICKGGGGVYVPMGIFPNINLITTESIEVTFEYIRNASRRSNTIKILIVI